ncbi:MAG: cytidine deaminase [Planctomycetota bacterium]
MEEASLSSLPEIEQDALRLAKELAENAHAPYSRFRVGAALVAGADALFGGCNVENASYGLTLCAERAAAAAAVAAGVREFRSLALYTRTAEPTLPCGACRQFLAEFAPGLRILSACDAERVALTTLAELLPGAFRSPG